MLGKAALNTGDTTTANDAFRRAAEHGVSYEPAQPH